MKADLLRIEQTDAGTIGVLRIDGIAFCATLELPDRENKSNESCIPEGDYFCGRVQSPKYGATYGVLDVPGRSHILFHAGNTIQDTKGCILLGESFGKLGESRAVLNSGRTFRLFKNICEIKIELPLDGFPLTVRNV